MMETAMMARLRCENRNLANDLVEVLAAVERDEIVTDSPLEEQDDLAYDEVSTRWDDEDLELEKADKVALDLGDILSGGLPE